jgi:anti-sigma factor RsiW
MNDEEIASLLPWYVNGTLSEAERSEVEALLARSNRARNELEFFRELSKQVKE